MTDLISREAAIDAVMDELKRAPTNAIRAKARIEALPSAHPELNEWCHDCKEYDQEHHCCPRWNRVIKTTLEEAQPEKPTEEILNDAHNEGYDVGYWAGRRDYEQKWIPCSERLPEDYEDVLVWFEYFRYGYYNRLYQTHGIGDYSSEYDSWMINHESGWSKLRVLAWMPLPEVYKGEQE